LPQQPGVGRIMHGAKVTVLPVFVNGLTNSIAKQVVGNATRRGEPITVVFGAPVDFGDRLEQAPSPRAYRRVAERAMEAIAALAEEERSVARRCCAARGSAATPHLSRVRATDERRLFRGRHCSFLDISSVACGNLPKPS
jgi:hypothetical protein